ncbi:Rab3 GTPase-activating protein catalytic subunit (s) [Orchesella cincta]|uniref:Rab3 GTPase-activating protein catalytic subunit n=1 Tax=Orchesella cincta TaxID=48709 RepID=A0A1D2NF50_ORCCI|nr:Rab3 GTPase-activating protein catalytic subunit (s) [Orchesella cincta]
MCSRSLLSSLERGAPNSNSCLLNQKLQMLNCCIEKKIARAEKENEKNVSEDAELAEPEQESEDDDDEFFDCDDTVNSNANQVPITKFVKPTGRLRKCGRLRLLNSGEPMYIPITQDPAPLTEDVVEEQAKILVELGNDAEGTEMRAKMMSASLLSDMESFKAANPGALLEDFVRWYSPRDWIESDDDTDKFGNKMGELSARMKVPGNLWIDVWSTAQPVPVRRQKRLFDDTREAEKVLHWLGNQTLSDICHLLFPCLIHAATLKVVEEAEKLSLDYQLPVNLPQQVSQLSRCFGHICGSASETTVAKNLVLSSLSRCEAEITQIRSFQHKFPSTDLTKILKSKQENKETYGPDFLPKHIKIDGGYRSDVGKTIKEIFVKEQCVSHLLESENEFKFGKPAKRVFVLKYIPPKSIASESTGYLCLPQRMSCLVKDDLFVSAGTFSLRTDLG